MTGLQQTHLAWLSSWNCLCERACLGSRWACRTVGAVPHDGNMSAVQWGTVSTWVASVGTVAAVSFALWEARGDRKERLRRELRQQAVRISAWFADILTACCLSSRRKRSFRSPPACHNARETAATVPTAATQVETVPHCTALMLPSWGTARTVRQVQRARL